MEGFAGCGGRDGFVTISVVAGQGTPLGWKPADCTDQVGCNGCDGRDGCNGWAPVACTDQVGCNGWDGYNGWDPAARTDQVGEAQDVL